MTAPSPGQALGMIEVRGLVAMTAAVEAMTTAASVQCVLLRRVSGGFLAAAVRGDLASVQTALEAGRLSAQQYGPVRDTQAHAHPHPSAVALLAASSGWLAPPPPGELRAPVQPAAEESPA